MLDRLKSWRGEKHITRQMPDSPSATIRPLSCRSIFAAGTSFLMPRNHFQIRKLIVLRIAHSSGAGISRTQVAGGIVGRTADRSELLDRALPRTLGAMRRNQHPLVGQRVKSPVRLFSQIQRFLLPPENYQFTDAAGGLIHVSPSHLWFSHKCNHITIPLPECTPDELTELFREKFHGMPPRIFIAPGRVNLIGEHLDYNDGFVLPCAIEFSTRAAVAPRSRS